MDTQQDHFFENRKNGFEVFSFLNKCIEEERPASLIRLGDGEAAVSGYPEITGRKEVDRSWKNWTGDTNVSETELQDLSSQLREAISSADVVGLPRKKQAQSFYLYQAVFDVVSEYNLLGPEQIITDAAIHRYLQFALLYRAMLKNRDFVGLISSRSIEAKLQSVFGVQNTQLYRVRGESEYPGEEQLRHFPDGFNKLHDILDVPYRGAVFLVGAGAFGKIYCQWVKERGGIAIDIGSIFEPWAEVWSRTTHPCHHMDVYNKFPIISREDAVKRYNDLCDQFELDTVRIDKNSAILSSLPAEW